MNRQTISIPDDPEEKKAPQACIVRLARVAIPVLKVARVVYGKLTHTPTSTRLPFTLDAQINSEQLDGVREKFESFQSQISHVLGHLCALYVSPLGNVETLIRSFRAVTFDSISALEDALLALASHLRPASLRLPAPTTTTTTTSCPSDIPRDPKDYFLHLHDQFIVVGINLRRDTKLCYRDICDSESCDDDSDAESELNSDR